MPDQYFDVAKARADGVSDKDILSFLLSTNPKFDYASAQKAKVSDTQIIDYLSRHAPILPQRKGIVANIIEGIPMALGAVVGGALGVPLGPPGIIGGAGLGAGIGRTMTNVTKAAVGDPTAPQTIPAALMDVGGATVMGAMGEVPMAAAKALYPGAVAAAPFRSLTVQPPGYREARRIAASGDAALSNFKEDLIAENLTPLQKEIAALKLAKSRNLEDLAVDSANIIARRGTKLPAARQQLTQQVEAVKAASKQEANDFALKIGQQTSRESMIKGAVAARGSGKRAFGDAITGAYKKVREIAKDPANVTLIDEPMPATSGHNPFAMDDFSVQAGGTQQTAYNGLVDYAAERAPLQADYERIQAELYAARQADNPGASETIAFMEGKRYTDIPTAIDNLRGVNLLAKWGRDPALIDNPTRLARNVAAAMRNSLETAIIGKNGVGGLKVGAEEALAELERAKGLLGKQSTMFRTKESLRAFNSIGTYGDAMRLRNDPVAFRSWWDTTDAAKIEAQSGTVLDDEAKAAMRELRSGAKRQIADWLSGEDYKTFVTRFNSLPPEVKTTIFTPDELVAADAVVSGNRSAIMSVVKNYQKKVDDVALEAVLSRRDITLKRNALRQLDRNTIELKAKSDEVDAYIKAEVERFKARLDEAQGIVQQGDRLKKAAWTVGLGYAGYRYLGLGKIIGSILGGGGN